MIFNNRHAETIAEILLNINNQKEYTKLKILFWNTPSLSLGTYIAISTGTGFILSYIITSSLLKNNQSKVKEDLIYNYDLSDNR